MTPVALTIAGSDPSGGAGLQADLKTFHQSGVYGEAVVTLITVQNTQKVSCVEVLDPKLVMEQIAAVLDDIPPHAAKTGALGSAQVVLAVAAMAKQFVFPLVVDPLRLKLQLAPFIRNYRWRPERGLRIHVFDKDGGGLVKSAETDPIFAFHHVNAFEDGGNIVVDLIAYRDAGIIDQLYLERLRASDPIDATGRLTRYVVPLSRPGDTFAIEVAEAMIELPRIDYKLCAGRPYRHVWGVG